MSEPARIAIFGPESTGKTRLAQRLAAEFGEPWVPEFVRGFWEECGGTITADDLDEIARGQIATEEAAVARAQRVVFCDTELLTCVLWDDLLFPGACPPWVRAEAKGRARRYAVYLLCLTDVPFEEDPQRCFPDEAARQRAMVLWRAVLDDLGVPYVEIYGDWAERESRAIAAVRKVLASDKRG